MKRINRRTALKAGAALAGSALAAPAILTYGRGENPIKLGMIDPVTGVYAAVALSEVAGAKVAVEDINSKGGVLGREGLSVVSDGVQGRHNHARNYEITSARKRHFLRRHCGA